MSYRIKISPEVATDLHSIYQYIAQDSPDNAAKMVGRILDSIDSLKTFPLRNVATHQHRRLASPVRSLPVPPYMVYFRVLDAEELIHVLTVRHGARRRPRRFGN